jgi:hypothetical protein
MVINKDKGVMDYEIVIIKSAFFGIHSSSYIEIEIYISPFEMMKSSRPLGEYTFLQKIHLCIYFFCKIELIKVKNIIRIKDSVITERRHKLSFWALQFWPSKMGCYGDKKKVNDQSMGLNVVHSAQND